MATFYAVGSGELQAFKLIAEGWDAVHHAASSDFVYDDDFGVWAENGIITFWQISRSGISFAVSPASIVAASIFLHLNNNYLDTTDGHFDTILVSGADLADTLVAADYGELLDDVTSFGSINSANITLNDWNEIPLNAAGLVALNAALASGKFRVGVRHSKDVNDTPPNGTSYAYFYGYTGADKPKITYTTGFIPRIFYF